MPSVNCNSSAATAVSVKARPSPPFWRRSATIYLTELVTLGRPLSIPKSREDTMSADQGLTIVGNQSAPFVYCDGVSAYGTQNGAIQIELAARTIIPSQDGTTTRNEF